MENVISFGLDYPGSFAVMEKDVFRVEVFSSDEAVGTAGVYVMPYRNSIMTLVHVEELVFGKRAAALEKGQQLPTLIVEHKNQYLGLIVREIQDLEPVEMNIVPSLKKKQGVKGTILHKGSILVMLELDEIRKILEDDSLQEDLPGASAA
jgi:chemotaxis protein histidine kinase CheA